MLERLFFLNVSCITNGTEYRKTLWAKVHGVTYVMNRTEKEQ